MKLYKAVTKAPLASTGKREVMWAGTQAEARAAKKALCEKHGLKATGADFTEVDVPTAKPLFLAWLRENIRHQD